MAGAEGEQNHGGAEQQGGPHRGQPGAQQQITLANDGSLTNPSAYAFTVTAAAADHIALTGASSATAGVNSGDLTATLKGQQPIHQELQCSEATPPQIVLTLQPVPTELAALSVKTDPPGASILLDGKPPQRPPNTFTHVGFGPHRLTATLDRYEPLTQELEVREGMSPEVGLTLRPVPTELAALSVQTEPPGASILLDGKRPQQPPNTFTRVPFGHHQLTATADRYEPLTQELEVRDRGRYKADDPLRRRLAW